MMNTARHVMNNSLKQASGKLWWLVFLFIIVFVGSGPSGSPLQAQQTAIDDDEEIDIHEYKGPIRKFKKPQYAENSPRIAFDRDDRTYDFGTIVQQGSKDLNVIVRNAGKSDLIIKEVKTDCGCTAALLSSTTIPPGGTADLKITFDVGMRSGNQSKQVRVVSNDPVKRTSVIMLKARIIQVFTLDPLYVAFGTLNKENLAEKRYVTIKTAATESVKPFEILDIEIDNPHIGVVEITADNTDQKKLAVSIKDTLPIGMFSSTVTLKTSNTDRPTATFKVSGNRLGVISVRPNTVLFQMTAKQDSVAKSVYLTHLEKKPVNIQKVTIVKPSDFEQTSQKLKRSNPKLTVLEPGATDITWEKESSSTDGSVKYTLTFKRHLNDDEVVAGQISFLTDDPEHREVIVDFYGYRGSFNPIQRRMKVNDTDDDATKIQRKGLSEARTTH